MFEEVFSGFDALLVSLTHDVLSQSNSAFASNPLTISAIRPTQAEYNLVAFRYSNNRCIFDGRPES